ncbi:hypothetical protein IT570_01795 [Candidatus Sumerlaeota bacterium]|nr:hypothetical protein [Candidatus Sumerlaeota bacterium]
MTIFLTAFLFFLFQLVYRPSVSDQDPWVKEYRSFLESQDDGNAMRPVLDALNTVDWESFHRQKKAMRELALGGWKDSHPEVERVLSENAGLVEAVRESAKMESVTFPTTTDRGVDAPRPPFDLLESVAFFLTANARFLEAGGYPNDAMLRLGETAILGQRFCRPRDEASLSGHLAGLAMIDLSLNGMLQVVSHTIPSTEVLQSCYERLTVIDRDLVSVADALEADADVFAKEIISRGESPARLASGLQYYDRNLSDGDARQLAGKLKSDLPTFDDQQAKLWEAVGGALRSPYPSRPVMDDAWLEQQTPNRLARMYFPNVQALAVRETATRSRLRLMRAVCLDLLGQHQEARALLDPFSGKPFRWGENHVRSVGPDAIDDLGALLYEPNRGVVSGGDIVAFLPPIAD